MEPIETEHIAAGQDPKWPTRLSGGSRRVIRRGKGLRLL